MVGDESECTGKTAAGDDGEGSEGLAVAVAWQDWLWLHCLRARALVGT